MNFEWKQNWLKKERKKEINYNEMTKVNSLTIATYFDKECNDYVLYLFQLPNNDKSKGEELYEEVFHIADSEVNARKVYRRAVELSELEKKPNEIRSEIENYIKLLE